MPWNWELPKWPHFAYDPTIVRQKERQFLLGIGKACAYLKNLEDSEYNRFIIEILSSEGQESSKIEGEILDRESLQSSIKQHFGLKTSIKKRPNKEIGMAELVCNVYETFNQPLSHEMLYQWHDNLFEGNTDHFGKYRTHTEPMQIVSNRFDIPKVFFEAPPSIKVPKEMKTFIKWYNSTNTTESILGRTSIAHVYFESIHPFEDGNGRIGRALVEKMLSKSVGSAALIAVSRILEKRKKEYYAALEQCNRSLEASNWVEFFSDVILQAQQESMELLNFLIQKTKIMTSLANKLNPRQEKTLLRMFKEGPNGFKGGISAEKYISITKTSKATATRDLIDLTQKGALLRSGELRHTRYHLNLLK